MPSIAPTDTPRTDTGHRKPPNRGHPTTGTLPPASFILIFSGKSSEKTSESLAVATHGAIDRGPRMVPSIAGHARCHRSWATHGAIDRATTEPSIARVVRLLIVFMCCPRCHRSRHARCHRSRQARCHRSRATDAPRTRHARTDAPRTDTIVVSRICYYLGPPPRIACYYYHHYYY